MMKRTFLTLLATASLMTLAAIPQFTAQAQGSRGNRLAAELNLTSDQQAEMQALREATQAQIQDLLTPAQQQAMAAAIANGENPRRAMRNLDLSADQQAQMREIKDAKQDQMAEILTPEQQAQLEEMQESRSGRKGDGKGGDRLERLAEELGLTDDQRAQMQAMREETRELIQGVLTPEQRAEVEAAVAGGENPRRAMRNLELSEAQRAQMQDIKASRRAQIENILTPEQLAQLEEMRESRQGERGEREAR
ncbi:MAG: Spy/CpxP family protein refolding chaperone [Cyanobacteria bacterium P01_G01_bin.54]